MSTAVLVMRRFEEVIKESEDQPLYLSDVRAAVGVPARTLNKYCANQIGLARWSRS